MFTFFSGGALDTREQDRTNVELGEEHLYYQLSGAPAQNQQPRRRSSSGSLSAHNNPELTQLREAALDLQEKIAAIERKEAMAPILKGMQDGVRSKPSITTDESTEKRRNLDQYLTNCDTYIKAGNIDRANEELDNYIRLATTPRHGREFANTHSFKEFIRGLRQQGKDDANAYVYNRYLIVLMDECISLVPEGEISNTQNKRGYLQELRDGFANKDDWNQKKQALSLFHKEILQEERGCHFFKSTLRVTFSSGLEVLEELDPVFKHEQSTLVMS